MAHVDLPDLPGIAALWAQFPETGELLAAFAQQLLRGPSPLPPDERELIAAYVSSLNGCSFCARTHSATAREMLGPRRALLDQVLNDLETAPVDDKLRALLRIADKVQQSGRDVLAADVEAARAAGADDRDIHDTVLIASAFCMFNRYVDGLAAPTPDGDEMYELIGRLVASQGYAGSS